MKITSLTADELELKSAGQVAQFLNVPVQKITPSYRGGRLNIDISY
jgi:hypothetical protein